MRRMWTLANQDCRASDAPSLYFRTPFRKPCSSCSLPPVVNQKEASMACAVGECARTVYSGIIGRCAVRNDVCQ